MAKLLSTVLAGELWGAWAQLAGLPEWGLVVQGKPHNAVLIDYETPPEWFVDQVAAPLADARASGETYIGIPAPDEPFVYGPPVGYEHWVVEGSDDAPITLPGAVVTTGPLYWVVAVMLGVAVYAWTQS